MKDKILNVYNLIYKILYWIFYGLVMIFSLLIVFRYISNKIQYPDAMEGELAIFAIYLIALTWYALMFIITLVSFIINKIFKYNSKQYKTYIILSILNPFILLALIFLILGIGSLLY